MIFLKPVFGDVYWNLVHHVKTCDGQITWHTLWQVEGWLPRLAPLVAIALGLCVNLLAMDMAAEVFMAVLVLVMLLGQQKLEFRG